MARLSIKGYQLGKKLSEQSLRTSYEAVHLLSAKPVLLTAIRVRPGHSLALLEKRAQISQKLSHPSLLRTLDFGKASEELFFYTQQMIPNVSLLEALEQSPKGELSPFITLRFFQQYLPALEYIHEAKLTHRGLQTSCFRVAEDHKVFLDGFINARPKQESKAIAHIVPLPYLSPEQLKGSPTDTKTDLYALGVILCELLCGELPYQSNFAKLEDMKESKAPLALLEKAALPDGFAAIVMRLLAPRSHRYRSTQELQEDVESLYRKRSLKMKFEDLTQAFKELVKLK